MTTTTTNWKWATTTMMTSLMVLEDWFGLQPPAPAAAVITNINHVAPAVPRFTRSKFPRMKQYDESTWWTRYLAPEVRTDLINHPNGRLHGKFCKLFHISFSVFFLVLLDILKRRWYYPAWREYHTCAAGKPVSHIVLRLLGAIFYFRADASHYTISTITNISEEVHRVFYEVDCGYELHQGSVYLHAKKRQGIQTCGGKLHSQGSPRLYWKRGLRPYCMGLMPYRARKHVQSQGGILLDCIWSLMQLSQVHQISFGGAPWNQKWQAHSENGQNCDGIVGSKWLVELQGLDYQCCEWDPKSS